MGTLARSCLTRKATGRLIRATFMRHQRPMAPTTNVVELNLQFCDRILALYLSPYLNMQPAAL